MSKFKNTKYEEMDEEIASIIHKVRVRRVLHS
jgi:hypothetical protein